MILAAALRDHDIPRCLRAQKKRPRSGSRRVRGANPPPAMVATARPRRGRRCSRGCRSGRARLSPDRPSRARLRRGDIQRRPSARTPSAESSARSGRNARVAGAEHTSRPSRQACRHLPPSPLPPPVTMATCAEVEQLFGFACVPLGPSDDHPAVQSARCRLSRRLRLQQRRAPRGFMEHRSIQ